MTFIADNQGRVRIDFAIGEMQGFFHITARHGDAFRPGMAVEYTEQEIDSILDQLLQPWRGQSIAIGVSADEHQ